MYSASKRQYITDLQLRFTLSRQNVCVHLQLFLIQNTLITLPAVWHDCEAISFYLQGKNLIRLVGGGVQLGPLGTAVTDWHIVACPGCLWWWRLAGETEVLVENPPQRHFVHHKFHLIRPGIEPGLPRWETSCVEIRCQGTAAEDTAGWKRLSGCCSELQSVESSGGALITCSSVLCQ
jgi:hypothetical protein